MSPPHDPLDCLSAAILPEVPAIARGRRRGSPAPELSDEWLRLCVESTGLGTWHVDLLTGAREWSREVRDLLRLPATAPPDRHLFLDRIHPDDRDRVQRDLDGSVAGDGGPRASTFRLRFADGEERWMELRHRTILDRDGCPVRRVGTLQDVTDRAARPPPGDTDRLLRKIVERSDEAVSLYDADGTILFTNPAYHRIFPHYPEPSRMVGMTHEELYRHDLAEGVIDDPLARTDPERYIAERLRLFRTLKSDLSEVQSIGGRSYFYTRARLESGETFSRRIDITEVRAAEERLQASQRKIEEVTYRDAVTGLANRLRFREALDALGEGGSARFLVALIDIDRFSIINDSLGDAAGNAVLAEVGARLRAKVGKGDVVARLGGDDFAVLQRLDPGAPTAEALVRSLLGVFEDEVVVHGRRLPVRASAGLAIHPQDGAGADLLLQNAGLALVEAKGAGHGAWRVFKAGMAGGLAARRTLALDLAEAIASDRLAVHYQPLVDAGSGAVVGFEALARWTHSERGAVPPATFIPVAEDAGLIGAMGLLVLRRAIAEAGRWPDEVRLAVNLSPRQLADPDIVGSVRETASAAGFDLRRLELEITETVLLGRSDESAHALGALRALGIGIALDDFGTGFSSLSYLLGFPFTKIKIDRSFVSGILDRREAYAITRAVLDLASHLGMVTTAEGVETQAQADRLRDMGCRQLQGYLVSKPLPASQARAWLAERTGADAATGQGAGVAPGGRQGCDRS